MLLGHDFEAILQFFELEARLASLKLFSSRGQGKTGNRKCISPTVTYAAYPTRGCRKGVLLVTRKKASN